MKSLLSMLSVLLVAVVIGGASAAGTWYWRKMHPPASLQTTKLDAVKEVVKDEFFTDKILNASTPREPDAEPEQEPPVAVRPPYVEGADETSQLIVTLNQKLDATQQKETWLRERQAMLALIFADIRAEQEHVTQLRQQFTEEITSATKTVQSTLGAARDEREVLRNEFNLLRTERDGLRDERNLLREGSNLLRQELDQLREERDQLLEERDQWLAERDSLQADLNAATQTASPSDSGNNEPQRSNLVQAPKAGKIDLVPPPAELPQTPRKSPDQAATGSSTVANPVADQLDPSTLKKIGAIYDGMPADVVADVLQQLIKKGQLDTAIPLLQAMKDRQAAKVLAAIASADPATAASLTERLKQIR